MARTLVLEKGLSMAEEHKDGPRENGWDVESGDGKQAERDPLLVVGSEGREAGEGTKKRPCIPCGIDPMPIRAKHCKTCQRCVRRMDHHCICTYLTCSWTLYFE